MTGNRTRQTGRIIGRMALSVAIGAAWLIFTGSGVRAEDDDSFSMQDISPEFTTLRSRVEVGVLYNSDDSYKFGDYTGLDDKGWYFLGNTDIWKRAPYDSASARYWRLQGYNLGLESLSTRFEYGEQGRYGLKLYYEVLPKLRSDHGSTSYGGDSLLSLPPGWVGGATTADLTLLIPTLRRFNDDHKRKRLGGEFSLFLAEGWQLGGGFDRETKQGTLLFGGVTATNGGNPRATILPKEIDYDTRQYKLNLEHTSDRKQFVLGYYNSTFDNRERRTLWEVPYTSGAWNPASDFTAGAVDALGQPPDNRFDQATFSGGFNLDDRTRVTVNAAYGKMKQDQSYEPYTSVAGLTVTTPLPRSDLDGEIETTFLKVGLFSRPLPKLSLTASYLYDDRDNDSHRDTYIYISSDAEDQDGPDTDHSRLNHTYSYREHEVALGARYRMPKRTDLLLNYKYEEKERDFQEVDKTREHQYRAKVTTRPNEYVSARLNLGYARRDGTTYHGSEPFLSGHTPGFIATEPVDERFENHPLLRKYYLADRDRGDVGAQVMLKPTDALNVSLGFKYVHDDYDRTDVGLTDRKTTNYSIDVSYAPTEDVTLYGFYTYENLKSDQDGWEFTGGGAKLAQSMDPDRRWSQSEEDDVNTVGVGITRRLLNDKLELGADYLFTKSKTRINVDVGPALTAGPRFPDVVTKLHNVRLSAAYKLRENVTVNVAYLFEKFDWEDWAFDGVAADTVPEVITLGAGTPDDRSSVLKFSFVYEFE